MKLAWYRLLDALQHSWNYTIKRRRAEKKHGERWRDFTRVGRRYTRVIAIPPTTAAEELRYAIREWPGWEFNCPNCKSYSLVTEQDMPDVLHEWEKLAENCVNQGLKPPVKPTMSMAGCTNCKYRPGAPE